MTVTHTQIPSQLSNILSLLFYWLPCSLVVLYVFLANPLLSASLSSPSLLFCPFSYSRFTILLFLHLSLPQEMQIGSSSRIRNTFLMSNKWINTTKNLHSLCEYVHVGDHLCKALRGGWLLKWYNLGCFQPGAHIHTVCADIFTDTALYTTDKQIWDFFLHVITHSCCNAKYPWRSPLWIL